MLGHQLGSIRKKSIDLAICELGLSIRDKAQSFEGPYEQVDGVYYQETRTKINGVPVVSTFNLRVRTPTGDFNVLTHNRNEGATLGEVVRLSTPAIVDRALQQLRAGLTVDFDTVRASSTTFSVKKGKKWITIPIEELAAFVVREGWLLVDRNPRRPRIIAELQVGKVANINALIAVLTKLRPDADLTVPANLDRVKSRASKVPWGPSTAATRWAGTPNKRTRFFLIAALPALALLYLLVTLPVACSLHSKEKKIAGAFDRVARLAEEHGVSIKGGSQPLAAACAGKLEAGDPRSIIGYLAPLPGEIDRTFEKYDRSAPRNMLLVSNERGYLSTSESHLPFWGRPTFLSSWGRIIGEVPTDWGYTFSRSRVPDLQRVRYVVVAQLQELDRESKKSRYDRPAIRHALYSADVLDLTRPERPVCSGSITFEGRAAQAQAVPRRARRIEHMPRYGPGPLARAVLQPVCATGGKVLCEALARRD
jgi:hypothetical protein